MVVANLCLVVGSGGKIISGRRWLWMVVDGREWSWVVTRFSNAQYKYLQGMIKNVPHAQNEIRLYVKYLLNFNSLEII